MNTISFLVHLLASLSGSVVALPFTEHIKREPPNSVKAHYMSKLLNGAKATDNSRFRQLDEVEVDLSGYELKFEKCQFVKAYSDDLAADAEISSTLELQKFIIFRLCPSGTCDNCIYDYGEYIIDMATYLEATVEYFQDWDENMCGQCDEVCANDDANNNGRRLDLYVNCNSCVQYCEKVEGMEENGFLEASKLIQCQQIIENDDGSSLYAGGMCSSNGEKIKIGIFTDEYCSQYRSDLEVDDFLNGYQLSHALLKNIYAKDSCISCTEINWEIPDDDANQNNDDEVEVNEMCQTVYEEAGKCESKYGFKNDWKDNEDYANQYKQEDIVCSFVQSLMKGDYDEEGEIDLTGIYSVGDSNVTIGQVLALIFYSVGTVGFGLYAFKAFKLVKSKKSSLLEAQGDGAMA